MISWIRQTAVIMSIFITASLVLGACGAGGSGDASGSPIVEGAVNRPLVDEDFLHSENGALYNRKGEKVVLRGTNLGGWLIQEAWMCPLDKPDRSWGSWDTLSAMEKRGFDEEQISALFKAYQDNWITLEDLDRIKALGMNCVRVPFWYRNFQKDDNGTYYGGEDMNQNPGFKRLDWLVSECAERGIYVILDLHGAPGFQGDDHCSGRTGASELFDITEEGEGFRLRTIELWERIGERYRDNPAVAAYDLLNEPMNGFDAFEKVDVRLWELYDRIIKGLRAVDPDHVITVEGIWEMGNLPAPSDYGWTNMLYQTHNYNNKTAQIDQKIQDIKDRAHWGVPVLVGEFQSEGIWDYALSSYNENGISWTTWTYKGARSTFNEWFIYSNPSAPLVNPETDSYEEILEKWSCVATENGYERNEGLADLLSHYAKEE